MSIAIINARILTLDTFGRNEPKRKAEMRALGVIERGWIRCEGNRITAVQSGDYPGPFEGQVIDASGNVLLPAFVDCHTHACWAGDRFDEFEMSLQGAGYLDILKAGGGIMSTVRAVRAATEDELASNLLRRLGGMAALGSGTIEVKSGYGLDTENELKMLRAIHQASRMTLQTVTGTFMGAHAIDPGNPRQVEQIIDETLPAVVMEFPNITCDAFCEQGAWSLEDCRRLFEYAKRHTQADTILVFHNHPMSISPCISAEDRKIAQTRIEHAKRHDLNYIEFICKKGEYEPFESYFNSSFKTIEDYKNKFPHLEKRLALAHLRFRWESIMKF